MSSRKTRSSKALEPKRSSFGILKSNITSKKNEDDTVSPSRVTRASTRSRSPATLSVSSDMDKLNIENKKAATKKKQLGETKSVKKEEDIELVTTNQNTKVTNFSENETRDKSHKSTTHVKLDQEISQTDEKNTFTLTSERHTPDLEFDHFKSKDKSFTSASHVKVIRPLGGETETGRKIYALTVSETSKTSPKVSPPKSMDLSSSEISAINESDSLSLVADTDTTDHMEVSETLPRTWSNITPSINVEPTNSENPAVNKSASLTLAPDADTTERIEFEDGIVLEINEEEFGEGVSASQESFDSNYGSQEIMQYQNEQQGNPSINEKHFEFDNLVSSQESGISLESEALYYPKSDPEDYMDGKIDQAQRVEQDVDDNDGSKSPVTYPSNQSQFFGMFGLVKKSDIPKDDPTKSKLHREVGGKLRRFVKPKVTSEMVYEHISKNRYFKGSNSAGNSPNISRDTKVMVIEPKPSFSPKIMNVRSTAEDLEENEQGYPVNSTSCQELSFTKKSEDHAKKRYLQPSPHKEKKDTMSFKSPSAKKPKLEELDYEDSQREEYSSDAESDPENETDQLLEIGKLEIKQEIVDPDFEPGMVPALKELDDRVRVQKERRDKEEDVSRRSSNRRGKRKEWKHLLKANPDIYETVSELEKQQHFISKHNKGVAVIKKTEKESNVCPIYEKGKELLNESDPNPVPTSPISKKGKKKKQREREKETIKMFDAVDSSKSYLDLYEEVMENKSGLHFRKRKKKDWALAKVLLEEAKELKRAKELGLDAPALIDVQSQSKKLSGIASDNNVQRDSPVSKKRRGLSPQKTQGYRSPRKGEQSNKDDSVKTHLKFLASKSQASPAKDGKLLKTIKIEPTDDVDAINVLKQIKILGVDEGSVVEDDKSEPEPDNFIDILKQRKRKELREEDAKLHSPINHRVPLIIPKLFQLKEESCLIPHMCNVCWVNDHMYCANMKRTAKDLLPNGGCLHYAPCKHYTKQAIEEARAKEKLKTTRRAKIIHEVPILKVTTDPLLEQDDVDIEGTDEYLQGSEKPSDVFLSCDEEMYSSDEESPPVKGTETLSAQLIVRASQIKQSLGIDENKGIPACNGSVKFKNRKEENNRDGHILWSTHAAEIIVASENTWYYPPKHLNILYDKEQGVPLGAGKLQGFRQKTILTKTAVQGPDGKSKTTRVQIKVMLPTIGGGKISPTELNDKASQRVIKVRVHKVDGTRIVIQQIVGEQEETVLKETVLNVDEKLVREVSGSKAWPNKRKTHNSVLGDIIAREALKLVQTPRPYPSKQNLCVKVSNQTALIKVTDVCPSEEEFIEVSKTSLKKKKIICKKDTEPEPIVKEKGVNLYGFPQVAWEIVKDTVTDNKEVEEITNVIKENINKFYGENKLRIEEGEKSNFVEHPVIATNNRTVNSMVNVPYAEKPVNIKVYGESSDTMIQDIDESSQSLLKGIPVNYASTDVDQNQLQLDTTSEFQMDTTSQAESDPIDAAEKLLNLLQKLKEERNKELSDLGGAYAQDDSEEEYLDDDKKNYTMVHNVLVSTAQALADISTPSIDTENPPSSSQFNILQELKSKDDEPALKDVPSATLDISKSETGDICSSKNEIQQITPSNSSVNPIKVSSAIPISSLEEKSSDKSSKSPPNSNSVSVGAEGSSQTLTFTTKDIREKRPELIEYIKKAALAPVICGKLNAEKRSLKNMLVKVDALFTKLKAEMEQKKCLLSAVRSEKYWLEDRQKSYSSKIMTAVDQSVEVGKHLRSVQKSKRRLEMSMYSCSRLIKEMEQRDRVSSNDTTSFYPKSKTSGKTTSRFLDKTKDGGGEKIVQNERTVWVLNKDGRYERHGIMVPRTKAGSACQSFFKVSKDDINPRMTDYWAAKECNKNKTTNRKDKEKDKVVNHNTEEAMFLEEYKETRLNLQDAKAIDQQGNKTMDTETSTYIDEPQVISYDKDSGTTVTDENTVVSTKEASCDKAACESITDIELVKEKYSAEGRKLTVKQMLKERSKSQSERPSDMQKTSPSSLSVHQDSNNVKSIQNVSKSSISPSEQENEKDGENIFCGVGNSESDNEDEPIGSDCEEITIVTEAPKPKRSFSVSTSKLVPEYKEHIMQARNCSADSQVVIPMEHTSDFINSLFQKQGVKAKDERPYFTHKSDNTDKTNKSAPLVIPIDQNIEFISNLVTKGRSKFMKSMMIKLPSSEHLKLKALSSSDSIKHSTPASSLSLLSGTTVSTTSSTSMKTESETTKTIGPAGTKLLKIPPVVLAKIAGKTTTRSGKLLKENKDSITSSSKDGRSLIAGAKVVQVQSVASSSLSTLTETMSIGSKPQSATITKSSKCSLGHLPIEQVNVTTLKPRSTSQKTLVIMSPANSFAASNKKSSSVITASSSRPIQNETISSAPSVSKRRKSGEVKDTTSSDVDFLCDEFALPTTAKDILPPRKKSARLMEKNKRQRSKSKHTVDDSPKLNENNVHKVSADELMQAGIAKQTSASASNSLELKPCYVAASDVNVKKGNSKSTKKNSEAKSSAVVKGKSEVDKESWSDLTYDQLESILDESEIPDSTVEQFML